MTASAEDRLAIHEVIGLHAHLFDEGALDRLDEVFAPDIAYDLADFGLGVQTGIAAIRDAATALGDRNPIGHHVTNIVVTHLDANSARACSKGIGIRTDGGTGSVVYEDDLVRTDLGWRVVRRKVRARRTPLSR